MKMNKGPVSPNASIIMSVFNGAEYVANSIDSILSQTFQSWECIIVDDNSSDGTLQILQSYADQDTRIKILRNKSNFGLAASLNRAIKIAKYDFLFRVDADDINCNTRFATQLEFMVNNPAIDVLGSAAYLVSNDGSINKIAKLPENHEEIASVSLLYSFFFHPSVLIRSSFFRKVGFYDESFRRAEDRDIWMRGLNLNCRYANLSEPLIRYNIGDGAQSWRTIFVETKCQIRIGRRYAVKGWLGDIIIHVARVTAVKLGIYTPRSYR